MLAVASHGTSRSGAILPVFPTHLIALGQSGQSVRHRHLATLVALKAHPLQDLAARQAIALPDYLKQSLPPAAAARSRLPVGPCALRCLARLRRVIGLDSGKLSVYRVELTLKLFLLIEDLLALCTEPVPLSCNILGKVAAAEIAVAINVGHSCSPRVDKSRICMAGPHPCKGSATCLHRSKRL